MDDHLTGFPLDGDLAGAAADARMHPRQIDHGNGLSRCRARHGDYGTAMLVVVAPRGTLGIEDQGAVALGAGLEETVPVSAEVAFLVGTGADFRQPAATVDFGDDGARIEMGVAVALGRSRLDADEGRLGIAPGRAQDGQIAVRKGRIQGGLEGRRGQSGAIVQQALHHFASQVFVHGIRGQTEGHPALVLDGRGITVLPSEPQQGSAREGSRIAIGEVEGAARRRA